MSKKNLLVVLMLASLTTLGFTSTYFYTSYKSINEFNAKSYNLKLNGSGGTYKSSNIIVNNDKVTLPTPQKNGYSFKGYSGLNGGNVDYSTSISNVNSINNKEIYAVYDINTYTLSYNLNGGNMSGQKTSYNVEETFTLPTPTKKGYTFTGWTGTGLNSATKKVTIPKGSIGNRSYTANWSVNNYSISYNLNGGSISGQKTSYNVEQSFTLPTPSKTGYTFTGWTGSNGNTKQKNVSISKGTTGNLSYTANWQINTYTVDVNPIIHNVAHNAGLNGFTFSVWLDGTLVADHVTDYYNGAIPYGTRMRVYVYDRDGYSVTSFRDKTWTVTSSFDINPTWYDNIPPTITSFNVTNLGLFNPDIGTKAGWNIRVYIDAYDNGTGIQKFQTWLMPYGNGSGSGRKDGQDRILENVIYLDEPSGRTFCAYAIDNAGNEAERCATIRV